MLWDAGHVRVAIMKHPTLAQWPAITALQADWSYYHSFSLA